MKKPVMRSARVPILFCLMVFCTNPLSAFADPANQPSKVAKPTPLILEKNDGERRAWRDILGLRRQPEMRFILKVDPQNGGSSHLVFGTEDMAPGGKIDMHKHPGSDEILFLENGTARVSLGDSSRDVHGEATVFIPANTWISVTNIGSEVIHFAIIFSAPGFEEFMRAESIREGEKNIPLSKAEDEEIMKEHLHAVIYK